MLRITIAVLLIASFAFTQLILDENSAFGKKIIDEIMVALNEHEKDLHFGQLVFNKVVSTLGTSLHYTVYLDVTNSTGGHLGCTAELTGSADFVTWTVGRVRCNNENATLF